MNFSSRKAIWIGLITLLIGLLAKLPANVALNWFAPDSVALRGVQGTLWNGEIAAAEVEQIGVGPVAWQVSPLALLTLRLRADVESQLPGGFVSSNVTVGLGGRIQLNDLRGQFDLKPFTSRSSIGPSTGTARVAADELILRDQWPTDADNAVLELQDLVYSGIGTQPLGSHRVTFNQSDDAAFPVTGQLQSLDGAFDLQGSFDLGPDRTYRMLGTVGLTDAAPSNLESQLRFLGAKDSQGRFPLVNEGSL